jgi:4,5-DOPA dioxygenase extradiol
MQRKDFLKTMALLPFTLRAMNLKELEHITSSYEATERMPVLFIGHGNPMNALYDNPFTRAIGKEGSDIKTKQCPKAILVVSAHWLTRGTYVNISQKPPTIHDFGGFPDALFKMEYPAPGSPEFAHEVTKLKPSIIETNDWGLDHGSWTILKHMFPDADIPVFQLSIDYYKPMQYHYDLATQLKALREKGVLIIGSGNIVHNLALTMPRFAQDDASPYDWAVEFDSWTKEKLVSRDFKSLIDYEKNKSGKLAAPTPDHYIPMLYTVGLSDDKDNIRQIYEEVSYGGMSMRSFSIG